MMLVIHGIVLALALGYHVSVTRIVPALVGALFVVIGNMMPLVRPNWWFGIRTPWTLSSDRVWVRTHRVGGYLMLGAGLVATAVGLLAAGPRGIQVMIAAVMAAAFGSVAYSYVAWRQEQRP